MKAQHAMSTDLGPGCEQQTGQREKIILTRKTKEDIMSLGQVSRVIASAHKIDTISGGDGVGVPPVPMPNTEVKTYSAESTWLETAREDRTPPDSIGCADH